MRRGKIPDKGIPFRKINTQGQPSDEKTYKENRKSSS